MRRWLNFIKFMMTYTSSNHKMMYMKNKTMTRTQIYLEPRQQRALRSLAEKQSKTVSELIREAVTDLVVRYQNSKMRSSSGLQGIIGIYRDDTDRTGSIQHDDIYD